MGLLDDKIAIVSGVGPGLGQAIARAMAREGAKVALAARNEAYLKEVASELDNAVAVPTDITDADQCQRLVDRTVEEFGGVDIVANSAFQPGDIGKTFEKSDLSRWRDLFEVNTFGALQVTQSAIPAMRTRGKRRRRVRELDGDPQDRRHRRGRLCGDQGRAVRGRPRDGPRARSRQHPGELGGAGLDVGAERAGLRRLHGQETRRAREDGS